jgi:hypothetical protein
MKLLNRNRQKKKKYIKPAPNIYNTILDGMWISDCTRAYPTCCKQRTRAGHRAFKIYTQKIGGQQQPRNAKAIRDLTKSE